VETTATNTSQPTRICENPHSITTAQCITTAHISTTTYT
jgi:hypothetical protein